MPICVLPTKSGILVFKNFRARHLEELYGFLGRGEPWTVQWARLAQSGTPTKMFRIWQPHVGSQNSFPFQAGGLSRWDRHPRNSNKRVGKGGSKTSISLHGLASLSTPQKNVSSFGCLFPFRRLPIPRLAVLLVSLTTRKGYPQKKIDPRPLSLIFSWNLKQDLGSTKGYSWKDQDPLGFHVALPLETWNPNNYHCLEESPLWERPFFSLPEWTENVRPKALPCR